jgi:hypothetical protein
MNKSILFSDIYLILIRFVKYLKENIFDINDQMVKKTSFLA